VPSGPIPCQQLLVKHSANYLNAIYYGGGGGGLIVKNIRRRIMPCQSIAPANTGCVLCTHSVYFGIPPLPGGTAKSEFRVEHPLLFLSYEDASYVRGPHLEGGCHNVSGYIVVEFQNTKWWPFSTIASHYSLYVTCYPCIKIYERNPHNIGSSPPLGGQLIIRPGLHQRQKPRVANAAFLTRC
jgi:hypothetical protein